MSKIKDEISMGPEIAPGAFVAVRRQGNEEKEVVVRPVKDGDPIHPGSEITVIDAADKDGWREVTQLLQARGARAGGDAGISRGVRSDFWAEAGSGVGVTIPNQHLVAIWVRRVFTEEEATDVPERSLRFAEEAIEQVQACGIDAATVHRLVDYVFGRPVGDPRKELAGCQVTLYALAEALGADAQTELEAELVRIQQPEVIERVRRRQSEKREATNAPELRS